MSKDLGKLGLLMWKNYALQIHHPFRTAVEVLIPVLCCLLVVFVRTGTESEKKDTIKFPAFDPLDGIKNPNVQGYI